MIDLKSCPVCGSDNIRHDYTAVTTTRSDEKRWQFSRCDSCPHGFLNPQPTWGELEPYYSPDYPPYDPFHSALASDDEVVAEARRRGEFRHVTITEGQRVLDVGAGAGFFLRIAVRLGAVATGVEPSPVAAERARQKGLKVFTGTVEMFAQAHSDQAFDLITANHVLEHTPDPVETLAAMKKLLGRGGGVIWISVPNADCYFCPKLKGSWHSADLPRHLMQFSSASLTRAGDRAGLAVESLRTFSLPGAVGESVRELLRHRHLVPRRLTAPMTWFDVALGPRLGARMDRQTRGEASLVRFRAAN
jgi:2-polyprenyl-3-methyl-5-hydroxy-6-metoxy-1,4-benzoquinol methylase